MDITFVGDFSQLEPVQGEPIYAVPDFRPFHDWVNCSVEIRGNHRFAQDSHYRNIMKQFQEGRPTIQDIKTINSRVVNPEEIVDVPDLPEKTCRYQIFPITCHMRPILIKDREAINAGIFNHHVEKTHSTDPLMHLSSKAYNHY